MINMDSISVGKFKGLLADNVNSVAMYANGIPIIPQYVTVSESVTAGPTPGVGVLTVTAVPVKAGRRINIVVSANSSSTSSSGLMFFPSISFSVAGTVVATRQSHRPSDFQTIAIQLRSPSFGTSAVTFTGIDWFYDPNTSTGTHTGYLAGTNSFSMPSSIYNWQIWSGVECPSGSYSAYVDGTLSYNGTTDRNGGGTGAVSMPWTIMQPYMPTTDGFVDISVSGLQVGNKASLRIRQ
jgi:hypothetical protein